MGFILCFISLSCSTAIDVESNEFNSRRVGELDYKLGTDLLGAGEEAGETSVIGDSLTAGDGAGVMAGSMVSPMAGFEAGMIMTPHAGLMAGTGGGVDCSLNQELCDGVDNDCDGRIDEDYARLGQQCSEGIGECEAVGSIICSSSRGSTACNAQPTPSRAELCDDLDNDCDGVIDEQVSGCCSNGDRQDCGSNVGACRQGVQVCSNGEWGSCDGLGPSSESCDGVDNDCDQQVDEGLLNVCGECGAVPSETCNGSDDDCDGRVDEGVANACGQCGSTPVESCDGIDNDCDGQVDEGQGGGSCSAGVGECSRSGIRVCVGGTLQCNASPGSPSSELCDGLDNDCDGRSDEGPQGGDLCQEFCDGSDNDLDGRVDEGFNTDTDVMNCGTCGRQCLRGNNRCAGGMCACGPALLRCRVNEICDGNRCCLDGICPELP